MIGFLLLNLGTPDAPTPAAVRRYLREFLSDPRVIDIHPVARKLLLELVILPLRPRKSAAAYAKVWGVEGSPLLTLSRELTGKVRAAMGPDHLVELAMRYGSPSIPEALERLRQAGATRLVVAPLYPQYSSSATGSSLEAVFGELARHHVVTPVSVLPAFYDDPGFLGAFAAVGAPVLARERPDHVLFSFHGLPERHVKASDHSGRHCLQSAGCCDAIGPANRDCYRAQCHATAQGRWPPGSASRREPGASASSRGWAGRPGSSPTPTSCSTSSRRRGRSGSACSARPSSPTAWRRWRRSGCARGSSSSPPGARA